jgi:hypothetical protein
MGGLRGGRRSLDIKGYVVSSVNDENNEHQNTTVIVCSFKELDIQIYIATASHPNNSFTKADSDSTLPAEMAPMVPPDTAAHHPKAHLPAAEHTAAVVKHKDPVLAALPTAVPPAAVVALRPAVVQADT